MHTDPRIWSTRRCSITRCRPFGGDDILVGEWFGTDRHLGNMGFDWITYYGETADVDVDFLVTVLQRPDVTAVRDRYDQLEAMSGGHGNDTLKGLGRELDGAEGADPELHKMTEATLDLVDGLRDLLQPAGHDNYAARFMLAGPVVDTDGVNNIILGGPGSDIIEGRGGDDFIDGDLILRVQLALVDPETEEVLEVQDSAMAYQERVFNGEIDPGNFRIIRELVDLSDEDDLDTAIYIGGRAEYTITDLGDGYYEVWHSEVITGGSEAEESEGADIIRNVEVLQFFDTCWDLRLPPVDGSDEPGAPCDSIATAALDTDSPVEGQPITVELFEPDGTTPFDLTSASDIVIEWLAGEGSVDDEDPNDDNPPVHTITEVEVIDDGNLTGFTVTVPFGTAEMFLRARVYLTVDGTRYVVLSPWTANPVEATQVESVIPDLTHPGGLVVGQNLQAWPPTDGNGVEGAAEGGWVYRYESVADAADFEAGDPNLITVVQEGGALQYTFQDGDEGRYFRVVVEFTDDMGFDEVAITNVVGPVTALVTEP